MTSVMGTIFFRVAFFAVVTLSAPCSARGQPAAQGSPVPEAGSLSGRAVTRTPQDIEKDRGIAPGGGTAVEVPNRTTVPKSEYLKAKQRGADRGCKPNAPSKFEQPLGVRP